MKEHRGQEPLLSVLSVQNGKNSRKPQAVRLWSELVGEAIWIILSPEGMQYVHGGGAVYTAEEIRSLRDATPEEVQAIHRIKKVVGGKLVMTLEREEK